MRRARYRSRGDGGRLLVPPFDLLDVTDGCASSETDVQTEREGVVGQRDGVAG